MRQTRLIVLVVLTALCAFAATVNAGARATRNAIGASPMLPYTADGPGTAIWPD